MYRELCRKAGARYPEFTCSDYWGECVVKGGGDSSCGLLLCTIHSIVETAPGLPSWPMSILVAAGVPVCRSGAVAEVSVLLPSRFPVSI